MKGVFFMKFKIDHDFHIHSQLSPCSRDPEQTTERILQYAVENNLEHIVLADHFWDENCPNPYGMWPVNGCEKVFSALPLPQAEGVQFHFGVEADMDLDGKVGVSKQTAEKLDFIVVPVNHMHWRNRTVREEEFTDLKARKDRFLERWEALLNADLPFHKVGLAHITCSLISAGYPESKWSDHIDILDWIPDETYKRLFSKCEKLGMGIELNDNLRKSSDDEIERILRVYRIAIDCGCHFYRASDAHHPKDFALGIENSRRFVDLLDLDEDQKFRPFG